MKKYRHIATGKIATEFSVISKTYKLENGMELDEWLLKESKDWEEIIMEIPEGSEYVGVNNQLRYIRKGNLMYPLEKVRSVLYYTKERFILIQKKPEWTILSFKTDDRIYTLGTKDRYDARWQMYRPTMEDCLKEPGFIIWSVRRESDGEVFTVGDLVQCGTLRSSHPIKRISMFLDTLQIDVYEVQVNLLGNIHKVKSKEWEITAYRWNEKGSRPLTIIPMDKYKPNENIEIYSVKRLSDGVEFKIGDKYQITYHGFDEDGPDKGTIHSFIVLNDCICVRNNPEHTHNLPVLTSKHFKKVEKLFTTEDGVDIYEGDEGVCYVDRDYRIGRLNPIKRCFNYFTSCKNFSTQEAAENYIKWNQPKYSLTQINRAMSESLEEHQGRRFVHGSKTLEKLGELK